MVTAMETTTRQRWGEELRVARIIARRTQRQTARLAGLKGPSHVAKAEAGQASVEVYDRLARHFGLTLRLGAVPAEVAS